MKQLFSQFFKPYLLNPHHILKHYLWLIRSRPSTANLCFVLGCPRSGTTLVQSLLNLHPFVAGTDHETGFFTLQDIFYKPRRFFDLQIEEISMVREKASNKADFFGRLVNLKKDKENVPMLIEKTPQHIRNYAYLRRCFPNAKFVHVLRDPRDCFCSARLTNFISKSHDPGKFAKYWKTCVKNNPLEDDGVVMTLRYESFTEAPDFYLSKVLEHLELCPNAELIDPEKRRRHKRKDNSSFRLLDKKISSQCVERWKVELDKNEIDTIVSVAGKEMERWGYLAGR